VILSSIFHKIESCADGELRVCSLLENIDHFVRSVRLRQHLVVGNGRQP
jgi:hypothetical protein